jgi:APA family basic amino acid/polyamine antiporter
MATACGVFIVATGINLAGLKKTAAVNVWCLAVVGASLIGFWVLGTQAEPLAAEAVPLDWPSLASASFLAFAGYARIATLAEEIQDPERVIPRTVTLSVLICLALYSFSFIAWSGKAESVPPWLAAGMMGAVGTSVMGQIAGVSRVLFAMGRRGFPGRWGRVSGKEVPEEAVLSAAGMVFCGIVTMEMPALLATGAAALTGYYILVNAAALKLPKGQFSAWIPWAGCLGSMALGFSLAGTGKGVLAIIAAAIVAFAAFLLGSARKSPPPDDGKAG